MNNVQTQLPSSSLLRVFPSDKALDSSVQEILRKRLQHFLAQWKAHGSPLAAEAFILYNQFVVVAINDKVELPSGCSLDSLFRFVGVLEKELGLNLNSRDNIYIFKEGTVVPVSFNQAAEYALSDTDKVFNLLCPTLGALETDFLQNPKQSSYARLFNL